MNPWLEFLQAQNAQINKGDVIHFQNAATSQPATGPCISPLTHYGVLAISGNDAATFIQNQFSNDTRLVSNEHSQLSAYCSPKGRVLSLFRLMLQTDRYLLLLPAERLTPTLQRLKMFVLMSQVTIEDVTEQYAILGCYGPGSDALLQNTLGPMPCKQDDCVQISHITAVNVSDTGPMYLLLGNVNSMKELWMQLQQNAAPSAASLWRRHGILAGLPEIYAATSDDFVPQMLNLHSLNAISFKKGCYPGQEVVARMHYLGKQKRRMYLAHANTQMLPNAGDNLHSQEDPQGQSVGKVVCAEAAP